MYYEHQYDRVAKLEEARATMTNYVLTLSAIMFTFGYQNATELSPVNGIVLPLIIIVANYFPLKYIDRNTYFADVHKKRARTILKKYAPELGVLIETISWPKHGGMWQKRQRLEKTVHLMLMFIAILPIMLFLYQLGSMQNP